MSSKREKARSQPIINVLDVVALLVDLPEHILVCGQVGTVVEIVGRETYEVEFSDDQGRTYAQLALKREQLAHHLSGIPMSDRNQIPSPFPVRHVEGRGWQVLLVPEDMWLACEDEDDARVIAAAPVLEYESLEGLKSGPAFADQLGQTADVLEKYRIGFGSRFFRRRAEEARSGGS